MTEAPPFDPVGSLPEQVTVLEASAGTGKTYTITSLLIRLIAERGVPIADALVVTFTRAATGELRDRVRRRLRQAADALAAAEPDPQDWLATDPDARDDILRHLVTEAVAIGGGELSCRRDRLARAVAELDGATIATIHGFCQQMLHHSALEAGADFDAELVEDDTPLLEDVVDDFIATELRHAGDGWYRYLREVAKVDRDDLLRIARAVSGPQTLRVLPELDGDPDDDPLAPWHAALASFRDTWAAHRDAIVEFTADLHEQAKHEGSRQRTYTRAKAAEHAEALDAWLAAAPAIPDQACADLKCLVYFTRPEMAEKLPFPPPGHPVFLAAERLAAAVHLPGTAIRVRFAGHVAEEVAARKRRRTALGFDDLLRRLADSLQRDGVKEAVRAGIRARYQVALIDEFQDTDPVQWAIFDAVFGRDGPMALIGDPKQAIYAFRGADVYTYLAARDTGVQRSLATNWRSDARYVEACNELFDTPGVFEDSRIRYQPVQAAPHLAADRLVYPDGPRSPLEFRFVSRDTAEPDGGVHGQKITKWWANRHLPRAVADRVVDLLSSGARIRGEERHADIGPGDLAVLVRTNRQARLVQAALRDADVPAVIQGAGSVYLTDEATAFQRLLDALLRPGVDRPARALAASVIGGWTAAQLATDDEARWDAWVERLGVWSDTWHRDGVLPMLRQVLADQRLAERLLGIRGGERRLTDLLHVGELAHAAEHGQRLGPAALAEWLRAQRAEPDEADDAALVRLERDADAVTVSTVHRSKGLEYPVVFAPYLWEGVVLRPEERKTLRFHDPDDGDRLTLDLTLAATDPTNRNRAVREQRAERLRLAYVALTRARHACVVWWGIFDSSETSPLASLLHGRDAADPLAAGEQRVRARDEDALRADLDALAARSDGTIAVASSPPGTAAAWTGRAAEGRELAARSSRGTVDRAWRRASFTGLTRRAERVASEAGDYPGADDRPVEHLDVDATTEAAAAVLSPAADLDLADVPLARFARGADVGVFLHGVLEDVDFPAVAADPALLRQVVDDRAERFGFDADQRATATAGLHAALRTPIGGPAGDRRLASIGSSDRLNELEFEFPLAGGDEAAGRRLSVVGIADVLAGHVGSGGLTEEAVAALRGPRLHTPVRGFLTGSVDLVCRFPADGTRRYLVVDYKSNWLGDFDTGRTTAWHYRPSALARVMADHRYVLQYHLYVVAVHRYLRWRLGERYDYDRDLAGVAYLFLRGMTGPDVPWDGSGPCGVFHARPSRAAVEALSAYLDRGSTR